MGAANVETGDFTWFDNTETRIGPDHVMASGALAPALPMVRIGTNHYSDGGMVSNTPLQHLLDLEDGRDTLVVQVDLFPARGPLPRDLMDVTAREKNIRFSSRTRWNTNMYARLLRWRTELRRALDLVPEDRLNPAQRRLHEELRALPRVAILHLIYRQQVWESERRDAEFSTESMREHWASGLEDMRATLLHRAWLDLSRLGPGIVTHDIGREPA